MIVKFTLFALFVILSYLVLSNVKQKPKQLFDSKLPSVFNPVCVKSLNKREETLFQAIY